MGIEEFFANVEREGTPLLQNVEHNEQPAAEDSQPEQPKIEEEKPLPYHKDPRWIKQREDLESERKARELAERRAQELEARLAKDDDLTRDLVGDDEDAQDRLRKWEEAIITKASVRLREQQENEVRQKQEEEQRMQGWVRENLEMLKDDTGAEFIQGDTITPAGVEFLDIVKRYPVDDGTGYIDFKKSFELYKELKSIETAKSKVQSDARKRLADATTTTDNSSKQSKDYATPADLRGGWTSLY